MENKTGVMLVIHTKVKQGKYEEFKNWQTQLNKIIEKEPGFVSQTISEPNPPLQTEWIITQYFTSIESAKAWLQSDKRQQLIKEILPILIGMNNIYLLQENKEKTGVTAAITTTIRPGFENNFLDWQSNIVPLQSKFPGFLGCKFEKSGVNNIWTTILIFDSDEHLESWLKSDERKKMLIELNKFSLENTIEKIYSGFDFWFNKSKTSQKIIWKENMLVLLTLYPVVFLLSYLLKPLSKFGSPFWLTLFISNALSTAILAWITVPFLMKFFLWWLHPSKELSNKYTLWGIFIILFLYIVLLFSAWGLYKYLG